ncbi:MAG: hypothetical protein U0Y10_23310 [Spirosomataceae bacterium]
MNQQTIYEVAIIPIGSMNEIRRKEPQMTYFSNLKKTIENVSTALVINGWSVQKINYTAVYRSLQTKGRFHLDFDVAGNKVFRLLITPKLLNPAIPMLGIEEMPRAKR